MKRTLELLYEIGTLRNLNISINPIAKKLLSKIINQMEDLMTGKKECCTILGEELDPDKDWVRNIRKNGEEWVPMFLEYVDPEKCIGCGLCVKVCTGFCYKMQMVNGKKVSVAVHPENCLGDCSCHLICPIKGGAMVCKPK